MGSLRAGFRAYRIPKRQDFCIYDGFDSERALVKRGGVPRRRARGFHERDVLITACARLCVHRKRINISSVLAGQKVGIKEVDEGNWLVSFMRYDFGYFDLEQKTLQPLDNPFGPRLSPMS